MGLGRFFSSIASAIAFQSIVLYLQVRLSLFSRKICIYRNFHRMNIEERRLILPISFSLSVSDLELSTPFYNNPFQFASLAWLLVQNNYWAIIFLFWWSSKFLYVLYSHSPLSQFRIHRSTERAISSFNLGGISVLVTVRLHESPKCLLIKKNDELVIANIWLNL